MLVEVAPWLYDCLRFVCLPLFDWWRVSVVVSSLLVSWRCVRTFLLPLLLGGTAFADDGLVLVERLARCIPTLSAAKTSETPKPLTCHGLWAFLAGTPVVFDLKDQPAKAF